MVEWEYVFFYLVRLVLIIISFFSVSRCVLIIKKAWLENDQKKMSKGISLLWLGLLMAFLFSKTIKGC